MTGHAATGFRYYLPWSCWALLSPNLAIAERGQAVSLEGIVRGVDRPGLAELCGHSWLNLDRLSHDGRNKGRETLTSLAVWGRDEEFLFPSPGVALRDQSHVRGTKLCVV